MSILFPNRVILRLHWKIGVGPSRVSIKWYPERGWSVRDFLFYRNFIPCKVVNWFDSPRHPQKWVMAWSLCSNVVIQLHCGYDEDITSTDTTSPIRCSGSSTCFRTAGKHLLATVVMASYGFQFGCSTTPWKDHQVYFETDPASCGYLIRVGHNHWFYTDMYSVNGESVLICFYWWFWE
jgi:hypothetical protein